MKNFIFPILIFIFCSDAFSATQFNPNSDSYPVLTFNDGSSNTVPLLFKFHFVRGKRNEQGICVNRGVCEFKIEILRAVSGNDGGDFDGLFYKDSYGNILLAISKESVSADELLDLVGTATSAPTFDLSNPVELPSEIKSELGLSSQYQIQSGRYPVTETPDTYIVNFRK